MSEKVVIKKFKYFFSLIPFISLIIAWIMSWVAIYKATGQRKFIFYHYIIWSIMMIIFFIIFIVLYNLIFSKYTIIFQVISSIICLYVVSIILSILALMIAKTIIEKYYLKVVE